MQVQPYLFFEGRCEEAIAFYRATVGAEVGMQMRFKDAPPEAQGMMQPGTEDKVMHAHLKIGDSSVMMSDGQCSGNAPFSGFSLSITTTVFIQRTTGWFDSRPAGRRRRANKPPSLAQHRQCSGSTYLRHLPRRS